MDEWQPAKGVRVNDRVTCRRQRREYSVGEGSRSASSSRRLRGPFGHVGTQSRSPATWTRPRLSPPTMRSASSFVIPRRSIFCPVFSRRRSQAGRLYSRSNDRARAAGRSGDGCSSLGTRPGSRRVSSSFFVYEARDHAAFETLSPLSVRRESPSSERYLHALVGSAPYPPPQQPKPEPVPAGRGIACRGLVLFYDLLASRIRAGGWEEQRQVIGTLGVFSRRGPGLRIASRLTGASKCGAMRRDCLETDDAVEQEAAMA